MLTSSGENMEVRDKSSARGEETVIIIAYAYRSGFQPS
jgi:hypothetical protein